MGVRILQGDIRLIDLKTRLPFKYGIATMTEAPQAFVRLVVEVDGREVQGVAADILPPKWFTKVPDKPLQEEILEMLEVIERAVAFSSGVLGSSVFEAWLAVHEQQANWGRERKLPALLTQFGTTLVERALIEAYCRAVGRPFAACVRDGSLGVRLEAFDGRMAGRSPSEFLPQRALWQVIARHTVGMADPLTDEEISADARLEDGLPQSLVGCIQRYGLRHFKLKLSGNVAQDVERLSRIRVVLERHAHRNYRFTLDGNESFRSLGAFRDSWTELLGTAELKGFLDRAMFVEQPFHRDVALDADVLKGLNGWPTRPTMIIDESDAESDSLARALALGYHGTSHKNCKGVFKGVANACRLAMLGREPGGERLVMSGEDLANIGPVALLQDLAVVATLGVSSVERNGHHYFAGLSAFPESVQAMVLARHGDIYEGAARGWPTLKVVDGGLALDSIVAAPLGVGFEIDVTKFESVAGWKKRHGVGA